MRGRYRVNQWRLYIRIHPHKRQPVVANRPVGVQTNTPLRSRAVATRPQTNGSCGPEVRPDRATDSIGTFVFARFLDQSPSALGRGSGRGLEADHFLIVKGSVNKTSLVHSLWRINPHSNVYASYKIRRKMPARPSPNPSQREGN